MSFLFAGDGRPSPSRHPSRKRPAGFQRPGDGAAARYGSGHRAGRRGEKSCADPGDSIIVAARSAGAGVEVPLNAGDVIRTLNGQPMTTLDLLRSALKALPPGAPVALQIQRDQKLLFISFTLDQP
ncbi:MAG: hypothetical protein DMG49_04905 [Acidobacteria bacterium]|nr:MAG: hypothetical protein DMG49_04905 [Acidobacteriota bacterium]